MHLVWPSSSSASCLLGGACKCTHPPSSPARPLTNTTRLPCPPPPVPLTQEYGHIDVSDPRNSSAAHPSSAFSPVQVALARLEAMTDVKPACYSQYRALYEGRSTHSR
jgi:hypothetical protein